MTTEIQATISTARRRLLDQAEEWNQRRARHWASAEEHRERAAAARSRIDRRELFAVAHMQELLAEMAKDASDSFWREAASLAPFDGSES